MTGSGSLLLGVPFGDTFHFAFTVKLPVVRDTMNALEATMEECGTTEGPVAGMFYRAAVMASALVSLGDIPAEQLTPQLLCDGLTDDDFDLIDAQISALKKKRMALNPVLAATEQPSLPSESTDSPSPK
ncbi:hypothetical protein [Serratia liquefaciens]|uniref:hypothetical protein n=1 Tax=Serratia liquefaciens TaxID=614 RepID=UPI001F3F4945|nr:hypothetical protein [Serratia liquefaciens]MCE9939966.1 hypothetical protein [Serratia liquefaciens]